MSTHLESAPMASCGWSFSIALKLGRVSNLPTVWTNTLAAVVLVNPTVSAIQFTLLLLSMSLAYTAGMFLNDAFDRRIDADERPERPIPSGIVSARGVFIAGFCMLAIAIILITTLGSTRSNTFTAFLSATALATAIVGYNVWHKDNPLSPVIMGLCRLLVYVTCAAALVSMPPGVLIVGASVTLSYLVGLTYTAKQERLSHISSFWPLACLAAPVLFGVYYADTHWLIGICTILVTGWILYCLHLIVRRGPGDIPRAVTGLIAGIALIDALLIAKAADSYGHSFGSTLLLVGACFGAFGLTLKLQRYIAGT